MTEQKKIRMMIVDDHVVVRSGFSAFLLAFDDLKLVGEAGGGEEGVRLCRQLQPDVVIMDLVMPGMDGIAATKAIRESCPKTQVIALTSFAEDERVQAVLKAGAIGYLLKNVSARDLVAAIRNAAAGQPTLSTEAARALIHASANPRPPGMGLTEREREVLALMVKGLNNSQIAQQLVISPSTTKFHVSNILTKLGVSTRTEAVAMAVRDHIVEST
jgi:two-component system, NarL family, response regulator LiaR